MADEKAIKIDATTYEKLCKIKKEQGISFKFYVDRAVDYYYNRKEK